MIFTDDFFSTGSTLPNDDLVQLVDKNTFENVNYKKVNNLNWYHDAGDIYVDGIIIRERGGDHYALTSFLAGKPINIELFGAIGDSITDDKAAFLKAAEFVNNQPNHISLNPSDPNENAVFEIPAVTITGNSPIGYKIRDTISFEKPVNFLVDKIFYRGEKDRPALIFKNSYKNTITTNVSAYQSSDFSSDDFVGILIQYAQHSKMYLGASFFTKGIVCEADGSKAFEGFAWNEITLKSLQSNLDSFVIRNVKKGWTNMNRVIGGEFSAFSGTIGLDPNPLHTKRTFIKFEKDDHPKTEGCNSWYFLNQAFEGKYDNYETLCFDFSAAPCYGISIVEPRVENVNDRRLGIFHSGSDFNFESNQIYYNSDFENENGIKYIGENPIVLVDKDLSESSKINGKDKNFATNVQIYVKDLEPFNEFSGVFPNPDYTNHFCQVFKIIDNNVNLWVKWHRYSQFVIFNEDREIITDSTKLQKQIDLIDFKPGNYSISDGAIPGVKIIKVGDEVDEDYINNMSFIPEAKYVGIIQRAYNNARLKVMINKADIEKIEKVKFLEIPEDTYSTIDDLSSSNLKGFNFNTGEKFYNFNTYKTSVVKEPGVASTLSGYTVDAVNGSRKFKVKTGAIDNLSIGTPFYIDSTTSHITFKITEKHGDIITTNIPSDVTLTDVDIIFPVCTYDTY